MIAIDTNILIYAHRAGVAKHQKAQQALQKACDEGRGWGVSAATVAEFWSIVTHPTARGRPSKPTEAAAFLSALTESGDMQVWAPGAGFAQRLAQLASDLDITGSRVFDLQNALTATDNGANELWTHDPGFVRIPGLRIFDPL
jgi:toxin-antitoxin system PIN domain toxin